MKQRAFMEFVLDGDQLTTPSGQQVPVAAIREAAVVRNRVPESTPQSTSSNPAAVVGGAAAGAVVAGPVGMVAGGLLGSTVKEDHPAETIMRTTSAKMQLSTDSDSWSIDLPIDAIEQADSFAEAVRKAAGLG